MADKYKSIVNLNIIQWNAQSIRPKLCEFENLLIQDKIHIAVLSETWLQPDSYFKVKDYNVFRKDRNDSYGGVAILTHKSIKSQICQNLLNSNSGIEIIHVKVYNCNQIENVISIYCPPSVNTSQSDWDQLFLQINNKTLLLGDFNGHHTNWSNKIDSRGKQIFDALIGSSFVSLNNGDHTRIKLVNDVLQESSPDISLVSSDISLTLNWKVLNETLGSDHCVIKIETYFEASTVYMSRRNYKKADWVGYQKLLNDLFDELILPNNLQNGYNLFIDYLDMAADLFIPYSKININPERNFTPKPYWCPNLSKAVAERRLALSKFRRNPSPDNLKILQSKISEAQRNIRGSRNKSFQGFCSTLDQTSTHSELWRKMRWIKGYNAPKFHVDNIKASELLCSLAPDFVSGDNPLFTSDNPKLEVPITIQELTKCLKSKDTAPGCDKISYSMIAYLPENGKQILLNLFNSFLRYSFVPKQWHDIVVVPIPKAGRDPSLASSLRPISMISCMCKTFHSILLNRLEWFIEKNRILDQNTTGFRKCRSTLNNLTNLVSRIQTGFSEKQMTACCFIDLDNAYNNVDVHSLLRVMDGLGVGLKICSYLWNFLQARNLKIQLGTDSLCRTTSRGLAQGDPLSPLLFNIATINICKKINNVCISQFADDFVLYFTTNNILEATHKLQMALNLFSKLIQDIGLNISSSKSKICIFKNGFRKDTIDIKINNRSLQVVENYKYLGLWLDRSLRWSKHINELKEKSSKFLNVFKILTGPGWGIHPTHLRRLYIAIIRSRIDYASFLYDNSCQTHLNKLTKIQNQCLRVIGGFIKSTAIHVMESELHLQPLHVRRYYLAGKYFLKLKSFVNGDTCEIVTNLNICCQDTYWRRKKKPLIAHMSETFNNVSVHCNEELGLFSLNTWLSGVNLSCTIKAQIEEITEAKKSYNNTQLRTICSKNFNRSYSGYYRIYTDGSKVRANVGAAFYDPQSNTACKFKLNSKMSVMHSELIAIFEAISYLESVNFQDSVIYSDCKSALQHLVKCIRNSSGYPVAYQIIDHISRLRYKHKNVVLQWLPSHIGIRENEKVDNLAKEACFEGVPVEYKPYWTEILSEVKLKCYDMWKEYFDEKSLTKGIWYRTMQPTIHNYPWFDNTDMSRQEIVTSLRLRSGHIPLNSFAALMGIVTSPNCTECDKVEDVTHIIVECVRNEAERNMIQDQFNINIYELGACNMILAFPASKTARIIYKLVNLGIKRRL